MQQKRTPDKVDFSGNRENRYYRCLKCRSVLVLPEEGIHTKYQRLSNKTAQLGRQQGERPFGLKWECILLNVNVKD